MSLISLILLLAVLGFCWYLIVTYVPMPDPVKMLITGIAVLAIVVLILRALGYNVLPGLRL